ncbi:TPA: hypothetical protein JEO25_000483 [Salmonella enterica subsp. enterica serovar Wangata]|nr:hypothetical protein [Salmonella enterica subsp. enterica serovar Wangata]HAU7803451.1 hypothetical protein [Salmonella enterica subsp. enterica serovar Wangata]
MQTGKYQPELVPVRNRNLKSEQMNQIACTATETSAEGFIGKLLVDLQKVKKIDKIEFINRKLGLILAFTMSGYNN